MYVHHCQVKIGARTGDTKSIRLITWNEVRYLWQVERNIFHNNEVNICKMLNRMLFFWNMIVITMINLLMMTKVMAMTMAQYVMMMMMKVVMMMPSMCPVWRTSAPLISTGHLVVLTPLYWVGSL